jgi:hypothetical protein
VTVKTGTLRQVIHWDSWAKRETAITADSELSNADVLRRIVNGARVTVGASQTACDEWSDSDCLVINARVDWSALARCPISKRLSVGTAVVVGKGQEAHLGSELRNESAAVSVLV